MKKVCLLMVALLSLFFFAGCDKSSSQILFSEITKIYFSGISQDEKMQAYISVGEREDPYILDGMHQPNVDFSLITVSFDFYLEDNEITIDFFDNEVKEEILLEYNPLNSTYIADLGYALKKEGEYAIKYQNYSLNLKNESDEFEIDYKTAIEKSLEEIGDNINNYYKGNKFKGECYLKILRKIENKKTELYWIFQIIGEDEQSNNVLISIDDGSIILSN